MKDCARLEPEGPAAGRAAGYTVMWYPKTDGAPRRIHFLLFNQFSMLAFTSSVEPLRSANRLSGRQLYTWEIITPSGEPARASNGIHIQPDGAIRDARAVPDAVVLCGGVDTADFNHAEVPHWLRREARRGAMLGGVCTGSLALARAGLLDGYRCTIHWENMEGFVEAFPHLDITATLFELDRDRFTCAGGAAALDMMIALIRTEHGDALAVQVAEALIHTGLRRPDDPQRLALRERVGVGHPKVLAAIARMESNLETPIPLEKLARDVGVSDRQLERLFRTHMKVSPSRYYLSLRLWRARALLGQTSLTVLQVAVACGFTSASHFTKCYRTQFGVAPKRERIQGPSAGPAPASLPIPSGPPAEDSIHRPEGDADHAGMSEMDAALPEPDAPLAVELSVLESIDPDGEAWSDDTAPKP